MEHKTSDNACALKIMHFIYNNDITVIDLDDFQWMMACNQTAETYDDNVYCRDRDWDGKIFVGIRMEWRYETKNLIYEDGGGRRKIHGGELEVRKNWGKFILPCHSLVHSNKTYHHLHSEFQETQIQHPVDCHDDLLHSPGWTAVKSARTQA